MLSLFTSLRRLAAARLRQMATDDRGYTTETVIWIAILAALALAVGGLFGPAIMDAAQSVRFQ